MQDFLNIKNSMLLTALALAFPVAGYAATAGTIDFVAGPVTALSAKGTQRTLAKGAELEAGDTIITGSDGRAQLRFSDGGRVSLQPKSEFKIDEYYFSGKNDGHEKSFYNLVKGGLRTISGWIGKGNVQAYRLTTQVATIGIRGTEFLAAYGNDEKSLSVTMGEGLVDLCNAAGCVAVATGETAIVSGRNVAPQRSSLQTRLPAEQPVMPVLASYSAGEDRLPSGEIVIPNPNPPVTPVVPPESSNTPLPSGEGNYVAHTGAVNSSQANLTLSTNNVSVSFDAQSALTSFASPPKTYTATSIANSGSADGVIGWGAWASGKVAQGEGGSNVSDLSNYHYVVGVPTSPADIAALNMSATYNLIGSSTPTTSTGLTGGAPTGVLTANFSAGVAAVGLNLTVPVNGANYSEQFTGANIDNGAGFSLSGQTAGSNSKAVGMFVGPNASYAGLTYALANPSTASGGAGIVSGALAFKR